MFLCWLLLNTTTNNGFWERCLFPFSKSLAHVYFCGFILFLFFFLWCKKLVSKTKLKITQNFQLLISQNNHPYLVCDEFFNILCTNKYKQSIYSWFKQAFNYLKEYRFFFVITIHWHNSDVSGPLLIQTTTKALYICRKDILKNNPWQTYDEFAWIVHFGFLFLRVCVFLVLHVHIPLGFGNGQILHSTPKTMVLTEQEPSAESPSCRRPKEIAFGLIVRTELESALSSIFLKKSFQNLKRNLLAV